MKLNSLFLFFMFGALSLVLAQEDTSADYLFPIRPGEQNFLSGTMGELRSGHFHGGLDIKTGGRIGLAVHAVSDGYISRIQISSGGYGHALYLTHDDGNTSVYAHLNRFERTLNAYTINKQYENESYEVKLFPQKNEYRFRKGDVIAYSGNTGSSSGPHLHFEIRDPNHRFLNPLEYGYEEIKDNLPPLIKKIAFITKSKDARINGAFGRFEFEVLKIRGVYTLRKPIELEGKIGVEIYHYDHLNGTYHRNGIPEIVYTVDDDTVFHQNKNSMSFGLNRHILVHMNYATYAKKRTKFNKLYIDDGNAQDIYLAGDGLYHFEKGKPYTLEIFLRDSYENITTLNYTINQRRIVYPEVPSFRSFEITDNVFQYKSDDSISYVYHAYKLKTQRPYFERAGKYYYLWDLDEGLPDSIVSNGSILKTDLYMSVPAGINYSFYNTDFELDSKRNSLFDTLHLRFHKGYDSLMNLEEFQFKNVLDPLKSNMTIRLKPKKTYDGKAAVYSKYRSRLSYVGGETTESGFYEFETRDLKTFTIASDSIGPTIVPISWKKPFLKFKIDDALSGIASFNATIDGQFLLMYYDKKKKLITHQPRNSNIPIKGEFILEVIDNQGNQSSIKRKL